MPEPAKQLSRHKARENAFIALFSMSFGGTLDEVADTLREDDSAYALDEYGLSLLRSLEAHAAEVDEVISGKLKGWRMERIGKTSLALLRLAVAEMLYSAEDMDSIVINEAVELAKRYGGDGDYQFINGVLGSISRGRAGEPAAE